jgi:hypothetical protein
VGSEEEDDPNFGWDFSGLSDPSAMRDFMSACDYCLSGCSDDGRSLDDEGYDPSRECFHIDQGDHDEDDHLGMPENDGAPVPASHVEIPRELVVVRVPAGGQDTQLEQLCEMQAKLDEETGRLVQLRQNIEQEWAGRALAGGARHRARDVQRRIVDDARAGLPPTFSGQAANASARHRKQECREVCSVKVAAPVYLDWSDKPITLDQGDHPDCVPSPGRYPLVVDPVIDNARLTKVEREMCPWAISKYFGDWVPTQVLKCEFMQWMNKVKI